MSLVLGDVWGRAPLAQNEHGAELLDVMETPLAK